MKVHIDREAHYIYVEDTKDIFLDTFHIGRYLGVYAPGQDWNIREADFLTLEELNGLMPGTRGPLGLSPRNH